ncbi:MAG TPA: hypothetical protein VKL21_05965 [Candidatus Methanoperedens sp.]|nr:hypothetical protein [Candidatus Methanoperedens sp.]
MEEESKQINKTPLAYMAGAIVGGVIVGYVMDRGKSQCCKV